MRMLRKGMVVCGVAALVAVAGGAGGAGAQGVPGASGASGAVGVAGLGSADHEADLAHHGHVSLWDGRLSVWLESANHGPSDVAGAAVRLRFSVPLVAGQELPPGCLWSGSEAMLCGTGKLRAAGAARQFAFELRTVGRPHEAVVTVDTLWNGGAVDRNRENDRHRVLVPATGDRYVF
ncbi:hypothetical protein [Streptomyces sp. NPDC050504]|uniref:hypothetical protein n=1 Tax=Streptomyces sp. NPDC050504 TaxID=3365618 RepID=UPI0037AAD694